MRVQLFTPHSVIAVACRWQPTPDGKLLQAFQATRRDRPLRDEPLTLAHAEGMSVTKRLQSSLAAASYRRWEEEVGFGREGAHRCGFPACHCIHRI